MSTDPRRAGHQADEDPPEAQPFRQPRPVTAQRTGLAGAGSSGSIVCHRTSTTSGSSARMMSGTSTGCRVMVRTRHQDRAITTTSGWSRHRLSARALAVAGLVRCGYLEEAHRIIAASEMSVRPQAFGGMIERRRRRDRGETMTNGAIEAAEARTAEDEGWERELAGSEDQERRRGTERRSGRKSASLHRTRPDLGDCPVAPLGRRLPCPSPRR
jgi:hypothetical protein